MFDYILGRRTYTCRFLIHHLFFNIPENVRVESRLTARAAFHLFVKHNFIQFFIFYFVRSFGAYLKVEDIRKCENASFTSGLLVYGRRGKVLLCAFGFLQPRTITVTMKMLFRVVHISPFRQFFYTFSHYFSLIHFYLKFSRM